MVLSESIEKFLQEIRDWVVKLQSEGVTTIMITERDKTIVWEQAPKQAEAYDCTWKTSTS